MSITWHHRTGSDPSGKECNFRSYHFKFLNKISKCFFWALARIGANGAIAGWCNYVNSAIFADSAKFCWITNKCCCSPSIRKVGCICTLHDYYLSLRDLCHTDLVIWGRSNHFRFCVFDYWVWCWLKDSLITCV